jgi:hypothetical protein
MLCMECGSPAVSERPERTAQRYRQFRHAVSTRFFSRCLFRATFRARVINAASAFRRALRLERPRQGGCPGRWIQAPGGGVPDDRNYTIRIATPWSWMHTLMRH